MTDTKELERIERQRLRLKNDAAESDARPGREAVVIRKETLEYYQGVECLLDDALRLAAQNHPPVVQISVDDIKEALEGAAAGALAKLAGIAGPPPDFGRC